MEPPHHHRKHTFSACWTPAHNPCRQMWAGTAQNHQATWFTRDLLCKTRARCAPPYASQPARVPLGICSLSPPVPLGQALRGDGWPLMAPGSPRLSPRPRGPAHSPTLHIDAFHLRAGLKRSSAQWPGGDWRSPSPCPCQTRPSSSTQPRGSRSRRGARGTRSGHTRRLVGSRSGHALMATGARCHVPAAGADVAHRPVPAGCQQGAPGGTTANAEGGSSMGTARDALAPGRQHDPLLLLLPKALPGDRAEPSRAPELLLPPPAPAPGRLPP